MTHSYSGRLKKPIQTGNLAPELEETVIAREWEEKLQLLISDLGLEIEFEDSDRIDGASWKKIVAALTKRHVPGFRVESKEERPYSKWDPFSRMLVVCFVHEYQRHNKTPDGRKGTVPQACEVLRRSKYREWIPVTPKKRLNKDQIDKDELLERTSWKAIRSQFQKYKHDKTVPLIIRYYEEKYGKDWAYRFLLENFSLQMDEGDEPDVRAYLDKILNRKDPGDTETDRIKPAP